MATTRSAIPPIDNDRSTVLSLDDVDNLNRRQHTIVLKSAVINFVLEALEDDPLPRPVLREALQELLDEIATAAAESEIAEATGGAL
jgi:hypothetical protein